MKAAVALGLTLAMLAATAQGAPRHGYGAPRPPGASKADPAPFKPWRPYKGFSVYGDDPTSLAPSRTPGYQPGLTPRSAKPFPSEGVFGPSGGTLQDRQRGRF